jgi:hypothetical protein
VISSSTDPRSPPSLQRSKPAAWAHPQSAESAWISPADRIQYEKVLAQPGPVIAHDSRTFWNFEPSAASAVLEEWVSEIDVRVVYQRLDRDRGVSLSSKRIDAIRTERGCLW